MSRQATKTLLFPHPSLDLHWNTARHVNTTQGMRKHIIALQNEITRLRNLAELRIKSIEFFNSLLKRITEVEVETAKIKEDIEGSLGKFNLFSPTELRVYSCMRNNRDKPYKQVAPILGMTERTFKFHVSNIIKKTGMSRINGL